MLLKDIAYLNESMEVVYHQDIRIEGAYIKEIKAHGTLHPVENEEWMDGSSLLMMPGLCAYGTTAFKRTDIRCARDDLERNHVAI